MACERSDLPQCSSCIHNGRDGRLVKPLVHRTENKQGEVVREICLSYRERKS